MSVIIAMHVTLDPDLGGICLRDRLTPMRNVCLKLFIVQHCFKELNRRQSSVNH